MNRISSDIARSISKNIAFKLTEMLTPTIQKLYIENGKPVDTKFICDTIIKNLNTYGRTNKCPYVIMRGERKGLKCGANISNNGPFCSKHKVKDIKRKKIKTQEKIKQVQEELEIIEKELIISKDKYDRYVEPKSGFVFKDNYTVCGKLDSSNKIIPLDKRDQIITKMHDWVYINKFIP